MDSAFEVHVLNQVGIKKAKDIAEAFDTLLFNLQPLIGNTEGKSDPRYTALVRTKLEEAGFFAKKAMAVLPENQQRGL